MKLAGVRPQRTLVPPELAIRFNRTTLETKFEGHRVNVIHYSGNLKPWTPKDLNSAALLWILYSDAIEIEKSFARIWLLLLQGHYWRVAELVQIVKRLCQEHHTSELYLGVVLEKTRLGRPPILRGVLKELRKGAGEGRKRKSLYRIVLLAAA